MNSELLDLTVHLEEKLKVPAEKLLEILMQQVKVEIFQDSIVTAISAAAAVVGFKILKKLLKKNENYLDGLDIGFIWVLGGAVLLVPAIITFTRLTSITTAVLNPEYAALKLILK